MGNRSAAVRRTGRFARSDRYAVARQFEATSSEVTPLFSRFELASHELAERVRRDPVVNLPGARDGNPLQESLRLQQASVRVRRSLAEYTESFEYTLRSQHEVGT